MAFDAFLPSPRSVFGGLGGLIESVGKVLTSPELEKVATAYLGHREKQEQVKAAERVARREQQIATAYAGAQVKLLAQRPELALLGPGAFQGYDAGGYLNAAYRGVPSPVYASPGAPAAPADPVAAAENDGLLLVLGGLALLAVIS